MLPSTRVSKAVRLAQEIVQAFSGETLIVPMNERLAQGVRKNVYRMLTETGKRGTIGMAVKPGELVVFANQKPYTQRLEEMIQELLLTVDDEELFEKAIALLEKKNG